MVLEVIDNEVIEAGIADAIVFFNPFRRVRQVEMELRVISVSRTSGRVNLMLTRTAAYAMARGVTTPCM